MSGDAYRNDRSALQERANQLRARIAELQALGSEREQAARELAAVEKSLGDMHQRSLPLLDRVTVASPCSVPWSEMKGDDRVRFCGHCSKNVFNLSALSRDEATAFVSSVEGAACVRFYRRADGTMLTADCPVGVRRRRQRRILGMAVGAVAALGVGTAAFAYTSNLRTTRAHTMGAIAGEMSVPEMQELVPPKPEDSAQRKEPSSPVPVQPEKKPMRR